MCELKTYNRKLCCLVKIALRYYLIHGNSYKTQRFYFFIANYTHGQLGDTYHKTTNSSQYIRSTKLYSNVCTFENDVV